MGCTLAPGLCIGQTIQHPLLCEAVSVHGKVSIHTESRQCSLLQTHLGPPVRWPGHLATQWLLLPAAPPGTQP